MNNYLSNILSAMTGGQSPITRNVTGNCLLLGSGGTGIFSIAQAIKDKCPSFATKRHITLAPWVGRARDIEGLNKNNFIEVGLGESGIKLTPEHILSKSYDLLISSSDFQSPPDYTDIVEDLIDMLTANPPIGNQDLLLFITDIDHLPSNVSSKLAKFMDKTNATVICSTSAYSEGITSIQEHFKHLVLTKTDAFKMVAEIGTWNLEGVNFRDIMELNTFEYYLLDRKKTPITGAL
ncbi:hypothetical protein VCHA53O466_50507 [Vibrio chagasii]|nr:hypothetical protein VCHA53O466_50507 [Vibrio chagasii]